MFLADAVAAYVESLTERELDAPLIALLWRLGFERVHLVHGPFEFGKDVIARRIEDGVEYQYCLQSKAGDLGVAAWRDVRGQVDAMRTGSVVHPDFDPSLNRRLVVVTNGRLKGGAGVEFQTYNEHYISRGEQGAELWDVDFLAPALVEVLVEGVGVQDRSRTLEVLGQLGQGLGSRSHLREYAEDWINPSALPSMATQWGHVLTGAMLAKTAMEHGREDLANQVAFLLLRAAWERPGDVGDVDHAQLGVARQIFLSQASGVWEVVRNVDSGSVTLRTSTGLDAFVTFPVKNARLAEVLALLAILHLEEGNEEDASDLVDYLEAMVASSSGLSHLISDEWAFSLLATVVALFMGGKQESARSVIADCAIWLLDWVEYGQGIGGVGELPYAELRQLLGARYKSLARGRQHAAYAFAVLVDLAHLCGFTDLYSDLLNDLNAVGAIPTLVVQTAPGSAELIGRVDYAAEGTPAAHHDLSPEVMPAYAGGRLFDCLATWATMRDRHLPSVISAGLQAQSNNKSASGLEK